MSWSSSSLLTCGLAVILVHLQPHSKSMKGTLSTLKEGGRWAGSGGMLFLPPSCQTRQQREQRVCFSHHPVPAITISPGHVTDRLLWRVVPISHSHGGVGESRRWSKHHHFYILIFLVCFFLFFFSTLLHAGPYLLPSEISRTSHRLLCFQPWPTAALICRLCLKRSGTSWRSWIWSSPRVRSPLSGFNSCGSRGKTCRPSLLLILRGV